MARKTVIESTCDQCGTEEVMDMPRGRFALDDRILLPARWLHVTGETGSAVVFSMDLCGQCIAPALEIAGVYSRKAIA